MIMIRKYIKIKYLSARIPFSECFIQFVIKKKEQEPVLYSEIQFYAKCISYEVDDNIQLLCSQKHIQNLAIYLMAINKDNRVSCIGFVPLNLSTRFMDRKEKLLGLNQQTGHIIYCLQDEPFKQMKHLVNCKISNSSNNSDQNSSKLIKDQLNLKPTTFVTAQLNVTNGKSKVLTKQKNHRFVQDKAEDQKMRLKQQIFSKKNRIETIELIEKSQPKLDQENQHQELQALYIQVLKHKLKNNEYFETIRRNHQFLYKYRMVCHG